MANVLDNVQAMTRVGASLSEASTSSFERERVSPSHPSSGALNNAAYDHGKLD
eukprot:CAMPEP_0197892138 /NCGR_PEP_ID=MMETSP1439-20131203/29991_1 /TAXON_ID=66791 /ORGANISM="Gonyaulax spinifera, Strain CCMP409" /LENGTH=52 /DNA_ID=CAMNT_0043512291 /DNA_START=75 /DNA_END=230 /DNA_ORIENTATION=+